MRTRSLLSLLPLPVLALALTGCPDDKKATPTEPTATPPTTATPPSSASSAPAGSAAAADAGPKGPTAAFSTKGFQTPECVLYDPDGDRYLVSNINGKPTEADGNGF